MMLLPKEAKDVKDALKAIGNINDNLTQMMKALGDMNVSVKEQNDILKEMKEVVNESPLAKDSKED